MASEQQVDRHTREVGSAAAAAAHNTAHLTLAASTASGEDSTQKQERPKASLKQPAQQMRAFACHNFRSLITALASTACRLGSTSDASLLPAGFYVHPALSDCALHLSAVSPVTPSPDTAVVPAPARVPVGLAVYGTAARATGACFGGWAASGVAPLPDSADVRPAPQDLLLAIFLGGCSPCVTNY